MKSSDRTSSVILLKSFNTIGIVMVIFTDKVAAEKIGVLKNEAPVVPTFITGIKTNNDVTS